MGAGSTEFSFPFDQIPAGPFVASQETLTIIKAKLHLEEDCSTARRTTTDQCGGPDKGHEKSHHK